MKFTKRRGIGIVGAIAAVVVIALIVVGAWVGWSYYATDQTFTNKIGSYYTLASQASNATVILHDWTRFAAALKTNHLDQGWAVHGSILCMGCDQNQAYNLTNQYEQNVLAIQTKLQNLVNTCAPHDSTCLTSYSYTNAYHEVMFTDICWFPLNYFQQAYEIQQGLLASGISAPSNDYLCSTTTHT